LLTTINSLSVTGKTITKQMVCTRLEFTGIGASLERKQVQEELHAKVDEHVTHNTLIPQRYRGFSG